MTEGAVVLIIFIIAVCLICLWVYIAKKFDAIANMKGHRGYFWSCFWLGMIGWLMVIALPDKKARHSAYPDATPLRDSEASFATDDELPEL